jgi:preprotein translocase subunit SecG
LIESFGASGELSGFDFPKLLIYLNDSRFEGKLIVNIKDFNKAIFVSKGSIAYVVSNDPHDSLDSVIIKYGMLSAEKFKDAVEKAKSQQKSVAKYLIENSLLASEDLIQASGLQIREVIKNVITTGEFSYFLKKDSTPENIPNQKVSPYQVTFDAFMDIEDMDWIHKQLGASKRIFVQSENFVERYKNLFYSEDTDLVVTRIDGKTDIDTLIRNTGLNAEKVRKILAALFVMNILKIVSDSPLDTAEPVLVKKTDTDTQQIEAEKIKKKASPEAVFPTEKFPPPRPADGTKPAESSPDVNIPGDIDFTPSRPQFKETSSAESSVRTSLDHGEEAKAIDRSFFQSQRLDEPALSAQPVSTSTAHYMKILERQRKKANKLTVFTLILIILFGLTAAFYIFIYQKNIESEETTKFNPTIKIPQNKQVVPPVKKTITPSKTEKPSAGIIKPGTGAGQPFKEEKKPFDISKTGGLKTIKSLMDAGNYQVAAQRWKESFKGSTLYTLSVEIACSRESITKIYGFDPKLENLFVLPKMVKDKSCFRVCWGTFPDAQTARNKINTLPAYYRSQAPAPEPVLLKTIL